jgi:DNA-binding Lrp family transcriptional regulator
MRNLCVLRNPGEEDMRSQSLDRFDKAILRIVQTDASLTAEALAERVGLSASAVQRRLQRLKAEGVVLRQVAVVDPVKAGRPTFFITALQIERERPELLDRLRQWLTANEQIQQIYYVTGEADFILVVTAPSVEAYDQLMGRLMAENENVRRFTTNVSLAAPKRTLFVPIESLEDR